MYLLNITTGRNGGTFAHWQIALAYAKYLSPEFLNKLSEKEKVGLSYLLKSTMGRFGGTFAHWQIALAYAKYLSPAEFHPMMANQIIKERFEEEADPDLAYERGMERAVHYRGRQGHDNFFEGG